ncbi:MAG: aminotransferase class I/II-fold pyridoxal phosphate-dependent enzyme, partial [Phycisphaerae bacterium]
MAVNFVDLPGQFSDIEGNIIKALTDIIHRGAFVGGPILTAFENKLAQYAGTKFAVGCSDGTIALVLSLIAAGIKKGDSVIVPVNTFIATANAVVHAGGTPEFVDCDKDSYLIDLNQAEAILKKGKTKFVIPVHLYGNPCPMKQIMDLAGKYNATVIEDNAQAIGASVDGRRTGSFGAAAGISFYPAKNLGAFGQGGAVLTSDEKMSKIIRMYIEQGQGGERYYHDVIGYNARLDTMQACILERLLD